MAKTAAEILADHGLDLRARLPGFEQTLRAAYRLLESPKGAHAQRVNSMLGHIDPLLEFLEGDADYLNLMPLEGSREELVELLRYLHGQIEVGVREGYLPFAKKSNKGDPGLQQFARCVWPSLRIHGVSKYQAARIILDLAESHLRGHDPGRADEVSASDPRLAEGWLD